MSANFLQALGTSRLYALTDRLISGLSHEEQVLRLSEQGITLVQLREKSLASREFYLEAAAALRTARQRQVKFIINDRVDIALALKADGVHLGQEDLPPDVARRLLGPESIIGISTHSVEQAQAAARLPVDYIAIGPVYLTTTKNSQHQPLGLAGLRAVKEAIGGIPLVAIGGITSASRADVFNSGADGVAITSDLWRGAPPRSSTNPDL
ncbi:MAG TPA: thiamine phosphate synthase [Pyrinomonadaceae bacterium]|nr:thiamine phosphate synthase [Pyrinomonadaceae bacterium]